MEENKKSKIPVWIYLMPFYALLLYPISKWMQKTRTNEIDMTIAQKDAFIAAKPEVLEEKTDPQYSKAYASNDPRLDALKRIAARRKARETIEKFRKVGEDPKLILLAVETSADKPQTIKALLDNEILTSAFMENENLEDYLSDTAKLKNFLSNSKNTDNFFSEKAVMTALANYELLSNVLQTKLIDKIIISPAPSAILQNERDLKEIISGNPRAALFSANINFRKAIKDNPKFAVLNSVLGKM